MNTLKPFILLLLSLFAPAHSYKTGAPIPACDAMSPKHGQEEPQTKPSPYKVLLNTTQLRVNETLEIILTSHSGQEEFKGFFIQVRNVSVENGYISGMSMGEFMSSGKAARPISCNTMTKSPHNAMTHTSPTPKKKVVLYWVPDEPGIYRVYSTFVKDYDTFWNKMAHEEVIEVMSDDELNADSVYDSKALCSDMKLKPGLAPVAEAGNPYKVDIGPVMMTGEMKKGGNQQVIPQKGLMWINISSEYGTPIQKLFLEVKTPKNPSKSYGKFVMMPMMIGNSRKMGASSYKFLDCFGGKENAVLYMNKGRVTISDVSFQWEAPHDEIGDFEVVGTLLSDDTNFWDRITEDKEKDKTKIKVVKGPGSSNVHPTASTRNKSKANSASFPFPTLSNPLYFLFLALVFQN